MTDYQLNKLYTTDAMICGACLRGIGEACNTPGCLFIRSLTPRPNGAPLAEKLYNAGAAVTLCDFTETEPTMTDSSTDLYGDTDVVPPRRTSSSISRTELIAMIATLRGQLYDYLSLLDGKKGDYDVSGARRIQDATTFDVDDLDSPTQIEKDRAYGLCTASPETPPSVAMAPCRKAMNLVTEDVRTFHKACDLPAPDTMTRPSKKSVQLRINLIEEECQRELLPALYDLLDAVDNVDHDPDQAAVIDELMIAIADGIADGIYVHVGSAVSFGIPLGPVWAEVQRSNMAKVDPVTGKCIVRDDGKVLKPDGWTPPDIASVLGLKGDGS